MSSPTVRAIKLIQTVLAQPETYTKKELMQKLGMSVDEMRGAIKAIKEADLNWIQEKGKYYRCSIIPNAKFDELRHLQPLTEEEKAKISRVLHDSMGSNREADLLMRKLGSLYDFQKLGLQALRQPELAKLDRLEHSKKHKKRVILTNYRSNSNDTRDRKVQVFHISYSLNTVQALDIPADPKQPKKVKHFMVGRMGQVILTEEAWTDEHLQHPQATDIFKIADDEQTMVHLQLDVYAYNLLTEQFPLSRAFLLSGAQTDTYDLQCEVNHRFLGLINFILSNWSHVEIISPPILRERILAEAKKIQEKFND